jgi:hypothetical protein
MLEVWSLPSKADSAMRLTVGWVLRMLAVHRIVTFAKGAGSHSGAGKFWHFPPTENTAIDP